MFPRQPVHPSGGLYGHSRSGRDPGGFIVTALIGIVGAFIGGFIGNLIGHAGVTGLNLWSILLAIVGSLVLLWIYRMTTRRTV